MSFLEFWGERVSPGKIGSVTTPEGHEACRYKPLVLIKFLFVVIGLPVAWCLVVPRVPLPLWQAIAAVVGGTLIYVALCYLIDFEPEMDNLGWLGGAMDNPVRYSDDVNRWLLGLKCLLGPGRFVAESVLDIRIFFQGRPQETS
ncbi:MAG: hypothetical protein HQ581_04030 [Planctomycetes bacterium]|nr:hypothetical protein [Planctomycetota bacterium]